MFPCHSMQKVTVVETGCGSFQTFSKLLHIYVGPVAFMASASYTAALSLGKTLFCV